MTGVEEKALILAIMRFAGYHGEHDRRAELVAKYGPRFQVSLTYRANALRHAWDAGVRAKAAGETCPCSRCGGR